jgi:hypothetical protein
MVKKNSSVSKYFWNNWVEKLNYYIFKWGVGKIYIKEYKKKKTRLEYLQIFKTTYLLDIVCLNLQFIILRINKPTPFLAAYWYRTNQTKWNLFLHNKPNFKNISYIFIGLKYLWISLRFWVVGLVLFLASFYYFSYIRLLPFSKVLIEWLLIVMFLYWLLSGFVFFIKKYQFSKFTSVIQRFWKRSFILFWLIEGGVFLCFFYLTMNASEEPVYMYDQMKIYKQHLFSWRWFLLKLIPSVLVILLTYYLQLMLKWNVFYKQSSIVLTITIILLYILWLEFYQFFHIINFYGNLNWVYEPDDFLWNLEIEFRRTRLFNNYIAICLLAKFWHLVFIFVFWVFFVLRINEIRRIRHPLLAANYQNFIFLYVMTWLYMSPWLKFTFRKQLDNPYYWFFSNARNNWLNFFFVDFKLFLISISAYFYNWLNLFNFASFNLDFFYWIESSTLVDFNQYKKHIVRDLLIQQFNA